MDIQSLSFHPCLSPAKALAADPLSSPSPQQLAWQRHEFIAFAHFGMNTFTDREWGEGNEDPKLFNPTDFDASQWAAVLRDLGAAASTDGKIQGILLLF